MITMNPLVAFLLTFTNIPQSMQMRSQDHSEVRFVQRENSIQFSARNETLANVAHALFEGANLNVVMDVPVRSDTSSFYADGSHAAVLDAVSEAFDLIWQRRGNIYIVRQGFARSGTRPQFPPAEMRATATDIVRSIAAIAPGIAGTPPAVPLTRFASTLTQRQVGDLRNGARLPVAELDGAQQSLIRHAMISSYYGKSALAWVELEYELGHLADSHFEMRDTPDFYWRRSGQPIDRGDHRIEWRWTWVLQYAPYREYEYAISVDPAPANGQTAGGPQVGRPEAEPSPKAAPDPSLSGQEHSRLAGASSIDAPIDVRSGYVTVHQLGLLLSSQADIRVEVSETVAERQMYVNLRRVPLRQVLDAVTELNGWEWNQRSDGSVVINRRRVRLPTNERELAAAMQAAITPEILQFLGVRVQVDRFRYDTDPKSQALTGGMRKSATMIRERFMALGREFAREIEAQDAKILKRLAPIGPGTGGRVGFHDMDGSSRTSLVNVLCLRALAPFLNGDTGFLTASPKLIQIDLSRADVKVDQNGGLVVLAPTSPSDPGVSGFGAALDAPYDQLFKPGITPGMPPADLQRY